MNYTLMHRATPVAKLHIFEATGTILAKLGEVANAAHLPVGIEMTNGIPNRKWLNDWWQGRAIPASRSGLRDALEILGVSSPIMLLTKCFGLSLSDQYWVNSGDKPVEWKDVNFFDNPFSEDVGNALFGREANGELNLMSPDNTSDGWLKKKWIVADEKRLLVKGGSPGWYQEPLNEALATLISKRLNIPHTPYSVIYEDGIPFSVCEDFINRDTDLVSAWSIINTAKQRGNVSPYQHFIDCCNSLGIPNALHSTDQMLVLDFLLCNQDRHYNNFGAVRNADTLEWIGLAPIFDSGTSVWYDMEATLIRARIDSETKPFRKKHFEQIKLVTDFSWVDMSALKGIDDEFREILRPSIHITEQRRTILCNAVKTRVEMLDTIIAERKKVHTLSLMERLEVNKARVEQDKQNKSASATPHKVTDHEIG